MNKVDFPLFSNEIDKAITEIYRVEGQIRSITKKLETNGILKSDFEVFLDNVWETLSYWTGKTYVGIKKEKSLQKAFQGFFEQLYSFILVCKDHESPMLRDFADGALYRGTLYRYLGRGCVEEIVSNAIEPEYNNIYVSWSKREKIPYIEDKLYGTMTLLTCKIDEPYYGIELEAFGVGRGQEAEVVFPTIAETVTEIRYIRE